MCVFFLYAETFEKSIENLLFQQVNFFSQFNKPATLRRLCAAQVFDAMGMPTVSTDVICTVNNKDKVVIILALWNKYYTSFYYINATLPVSTCTTSNVCNVSFVHSSPKNLNLCNQPITKICI